MKKQCVQCEHLNEPDAVVCAKCSSDLLQAQEVFEQAIHDTDASSDTEKAPDNNFQRGTTAGSADRVTEQLPCDCPIPGGAPGTTCFACGGLITSEQRASINQRPRSESTSQVSIMLPSGVRKEVGTGICLGRDPTRAGVEAAAPLRTLMGISRSHAWLCCSGSGVIVVDLGSRNGTWLGRERLQPWKSRFIAATDLPVEICLGAHGLIQIMAEKSS